MMLNKERNKQLLLFLISIIVLTCLYWGYRKTDFFMDEIYSFGLSNSYFAPFLSSIKGGTLAGNIVTHKEFVDYLTVGSSDKFAIASTVYNQSKDVHPPLFYIMLNAVSSLFPGVFSKWLCIIPNIIFYVLTMVILYKTTYLLYKNEKYGIITILLYGLGRGGISTVMMVRMYMLKTLLVVLLAFLVLQLLNSADNDEPIHTSKLSAIFLVIFSGLMTQYFFVFYAFFISAFAVLYLLSKKKHSHAVKLAVSSLGGSLLFAHVYFRFINNVNNQSVGNSVLNSVIAFAQRIHQILGFCKKMLLSFPIAICICTVLILLLFFNSAIKKKNIVFAHEDLLSCIIIVPAILSFLIISAVAVYSELRYVYSVTPILIMLPAWVLHLYEQNIKSIVISVKSIALCTVAMIIILFIKEPEWIYSSHSGRYDCLKGLEASPCVYYLTDDNPAVPAVTQDLVQLAGFNDVFFVNNIDASSIQNYISDHNSDTCIFFYMDFFKRLDPKSSAEDFLKNSGTGYSSYELLYETDISYVYKFTR